MFCRFYLPHGLSIDKDGNYWVTDVALHQVILHLACKQNFHLVIRIEVGLPWWLSSQQSTCKAEGARDAGSVPGSGRPPGGGHGNPL